MTILEELLDVASGVVVEGRQYPPGERISLCELLAENRALKTVHVLKAFILRTRPQKILTVWRAFRLSFNLLN